MDKLAENIKQKYYLLFSGDPVMIASPGRINLIGEHTDYNEGFVLPAAIDKKIIFAVGRGVVGICKLHAVDLNKSYEFSISNIIKTSQNWPDYLLGVVDQIQKSKYQLFGFNCVFGGDIPIGSGLSSSAALECGFAFALNELFNLKIEKLNLVKIAQKAENDFVGMRCGVMDQFVNIFGMANSFLKLDCRSLEYEYIPFNFKDVEIVLCDSKVSHSLASSEYNIRREQCETGVNILKKYDDSISSLRDVSLEFLKKHQKKLDSVICKRCEFVIQENRRVIDGCEDLKQGNLMQFGEKMYESHHGLKNDYEVTCSELDFLVESASSIEGVIGSRMMGGGFGGCTINLVKREYLNSFIEDITQKYYSKFKIDLDSFEVRLVNGTSVIK